MAEVRETRGLKPRNGHRLVLFPLPLQGHINSMFQLASMLYSEGFSITIIHTHFNSPSASKFPHFSFQLIADVLPESAYASMTDVIALIMILNVNFIEPFRECLSKLLLSYSSEGKDGMMMDRVTCLITDSAWYFTGAIAKEFKVRRTELRTTSISSFTAFSALLALREKGFHFPLKDTQLEETPLELCPLKLQDLPYIETKCPSDFYELLESMIKETKTSSGLIANSFEELEGSKLTEYNRVDLPIPVFPIGPFHKHFPASSSNLLKQDQSSIDWLNKQEKKSVLYVSFGSIASMRESQFLEIAWGLAESQMPFLWVVRPDILPESKQTSTTLPVPDKLMESINQRGHIVAWAPQQEVLAHPATGGFWSHCGWNSTLESICGGVPMICTPFFGDQKVNASYVSRVWKVGLEMELGAVRGQIKSGIRRLMVDEEGKEMRERMRNLKEKVESCQKPDESSCKALQRLTSHLLSF